MINKKNYLSDFVLQLDTWSDVTSYPRSFVARGCVSEEAAAVLAGAFLVVLLVPGLFELVGLQLRP